MTYPRPTAQAALTFGVAVENNEVQKNNGELTFDAISTQRFTVKSAIEEGGVTGSRLNTYRPPQVSSRSASRSSQIPPSI
jgi:hypothetical protein